MPGANTMKPTLSMSYDLKESELNLADVSKATARQRKRRLGNAQVDGFWIWIHILRGKRHDSSLFSLTDSLPPMPWEQREKSSNCHLSAVLCSIPLLH